MCTSRLSQSSRRIRAVVVAIPVVLLMIGCAAPSRPAAPPSVPVTERTSDDHALPEAASAGADRELMKSEGGPGSFARETPATGRAAREERATPPAAPLRIDLAPGVTVIRGARASAHRVEVEAFVALTAGWLEQVACSPGTREHEALFVIEAPAHVLHAALLAADFESGAPGRWFHDEADGFRFIPPSGSELRILVRGIDEPDDAAHPVNQWIVEDGSDSTLPDEPFVFGGSAFVPRAVGSGGGAGVPPQEDTQAQAADGAEPPTEQQTRDPELLYAADVTGSLIGLVTFGDEVIGFRRVFADRSDVMPQEWVAHSAVMPAVGTRVVLVITAFENVGNAAAADR